MQTKIVTVISLAGVLVAGSAAALVNTQVLGGSASQTPQVVDAASPPLQTAPVVVATPAATTPAVEAQVAETPAPAAAAPAATTQAAYAIGDSGTVTLDTAGDVLTIAAVSPADGWVVMKSEAQDANNVEVKFQSGAVEVEFHANLLYGVVTTSVDSHDQSATSNSVDDNGGGRNSGGDDDSGHGGGGDDD